MAAYSRDHGYSRRGIFGGSFLQLYHTLYAIRSAFLALVYYYVRDLTSQWKQVMLTVDLYTEDAVQR